MGHHRQIDKNTAFFVLAGFRSPRRSGAWWARLLPPVLGAALVVTAPYAVSAQGLPPGLLPGVSAVATALEPGQYARYAVLMRADRKVHKLRIALLEREGNGRWVEVSITDPGRRRLVYRSLIKGSLSDPDGVARVIVQPPGQKPLELPVAGAARAAPRFPDSGKPAGGKRVGRQTVKVAAGTFATTHYRQKVRGGVRDVWVTSEKAAFPVVKIAAPGFVLELAERGADARTEVKGKPIKPDPATAKALGLTK